MKINVHTLLFVIISLVCFRVSPCSAQTTSRNLNSSYRDSIANAIKAKRHADSLVREAAKLQLKQFRDSIITARNVKRKADSLARENNKQAIQQQKKKTDSLTANRKRIQDSIRLSRMSRADSLKHARENVAKQKKKLEKYKSSRHYRDSVALVKKMKLDSLANARATRLALQKQRTQVVKDSLYSVRQQHNDSVYTIRKLQQDSTKAAMEAIKTDRKRVNDSLLAYRKQRTDSLMAARKSKEKKTEDSAKTKAEKQKALALKIHEAKKEEWTNEKLLKRKWSIHRRIYQNTVTRYNYYYNAHRKYQGAISNLKKNNKDDFSKILSIYPYDITKSGTSVAGDMDSVIKKSSFSTQIHDPRSKWFDNLYFLMGRASYVKNDFDGAITTFQFVANEYKESPKPKKKQKVAKPIANIEGESIATHENHKGIHKLSHHPIRNDALLWLAKSYIQSQQYSEATALLSTLEKDRNFPKRLKADLYVTKASLDIEQKNTQEAIASLDSALQQSLPKLLRARTEFVIAQLYAGEKNYEASSEHFKKSISGKANPEMDFYTKLFIAENAAKGGGDKAYAINLLEKIIHDSKYEKYRTQAYTVMASIYENEDPHKAIAALKKGISKSDPKNPLQKARAFALLGKIYYKETEYENAKMAYDSASTYGTNPALENLNEVNTRKTVLADVVKNIRIIRRQDSLLALSLQSDKEQKAAAKKEAERLQKAEDNKKTSITEVITLTPTGNIKSNWYFYNAAMIEKGTAEFKQKWGNRKLEDNWRRRTAASNIASGLKEEGIEDDEKKLLINGSQYETLLAEIPKSPKQKDQAHNDIMNAYYDLGLIYYAQLQDYPNSVKTFDTLIQRYPNTQFKKQSYYTLFLDYTLLKNQEQAEKYKKLLSEEFGQTEFSKLANNPDYLQELSDAGKRVDRYYDTTYLAFKDSAYAQALTRISTAQKQFIGKPIMAKFDLLEAFCYAAQKDFPKCKITLEAVIKNYPSTPEQGRAQELLNLLKTTLEKEKPETKTEAPSELKAAEGTAVYTYNSKDEHLLMVYLNKIDSKALTIKSNLSDFNTAKHDSEGLTTGQNLFTVKEGVLTVSRFSNAVFAKVYRNELLKEEAVFAQVPKTDYTVCIISLANFNELLKTRDILGYLSFYQLNYLQ